VALNVKAIFHLLAALSFTMRYDLLFARNFRRDLSIRQAWVMNLVSSLTFSVRGILLILALALADHHAVAAGLTNIFYLGDSYLDDGNYKALINGSASEYASNSAPWSTVVNVTLGLPSTGRWTPAGSQSPLGNNYAVSGAGINYSSTPTNTSLHGQAAKLLADYPHGLPGGSLVVIAIGTNDVMGVVGYGGLWSTQTTPWKLGNVDFTVPAVNSSVKVPVTSTAGMKPGSNNLVIFSTSPAPAMMALTQVNPEESTVTLTNKFGAPGTKILANSNFEVCGKWSIDQEWPIFTADIKSIEADQGHVVLVLLPPTDLLPNFNRQSNQALVHDTWKYCYDKMSTIVSQDSDRLMTFDLKPVFQDVFSDPTHYGFKLNYPGWKASGSAYPDDYMFWDSVHPSGAMHRYIAERFLQFLRTKGLAK
jgi:lysophospholipase L1-like esterase